MTDGLNAAAADDGNEAGAPKVVPFPTPGPSRKRELGKKAAPKRRRRVTRRAPVRWSAKRETMFLVTLANTACVAAAVRASGLSETNVYRRRRQYAEFRAQWLVALREGYLKLETMVLERALNGVEKVVWHGGARVGTITEYNDRTALALLNLHRTTVNGTRPMAAEIDVDEERAALKLRLGEMNARMGGAG